DTENHAAEDLVMAELRNHFKPELLNRMDDIIIFHSLTGNAFKRIAGKMIEDLVMRLDEQEVTMKYEEAVLDWIVEEGTDADFGARPLKRFIQRHVETVVARELIKGDIGPNGEFLLTMADGELVVKKQ
ncbi:ATP-dependent Clp protease ATP-binding subunit, partial [Microvirga sp. 3-52]|nr:ATP-dependent Clp protease ATP-binding subunit [Microvirga sp. 3-52]